MEGMNRRGFLADGIGVGYGVLGRHCLSGHSERLFGDMVKIGL